MANISNKATKRFFSFNVFSVTIFLSVSIYMCLFLSNLYAQAVPTPNASPATTPSPTPVPTATVVALNPTIISRTTTVFINKEFIEIFQIEDSNEIFLADTDISVVVEDSDIASISVFNPTSDDQTIVEGSVLIAKTGANGQKTFVIKGLATGSTKIEFEVIDDDLNTDNVIEILNVEVLGLEAIIEQGDDVGVAPFTVQFFDRSIGKVDSRLWSFDDASVATSSERNPSHTFDTSGLFHVTLNLIQEANIGTITDSASVSVCVIPGDSTGLPGVIFGTVFNPVDNLPIRNVEITMLSGTDERQQKTGRDGTYRFEDVLPGQIIFTVCKAIFYDCIVEDLIFDGGSLPKNFKLSLKPEFQ